MSAAMKWIHPYKPHISPQRLYHSQSYDPDELSEGELEELNKSSEKVVRLVPRRKAVCGLFGIHDDYIEKFQSLDSRFIRNRASTFFFEASSDSMEPLIFKKDVLIVDRSVEAHHKKVAVLSLHGEMICKRILKENNGLLLRSENPDYKDIIVTEEMDLIIFGVVIGIAREFL